MVSAWLDYRCHATSCERPCVREEVVAVVVEQTLRSLVFSPDERCLLRDEVRAVLAASRSDEASRAEVGRCQLGQLEQRLARLTDALVDGLVAKEVFEERRRALLLEERALKEEIDDAGQERDLGAEVEQLFERADMAWLSYEMATDDEKRQSLDLLTSNRRVSRENVVVELRFPWNAIAERTSVTDCDPVGI